MEKKFFLIILFLSVYNVFSQTVISDIAKKNNIEFYILESEYTQGKYINEPMDKEIFKKYNWKNLPAQYKGANRMLSLKSEFIPVAKIQNNMFYLISLPMEYPSNYYLNGKLIFQRGNREGKYTNRLHYSEKILLPPYLIHWDSINDLTIELYPKNNEQQAFLQPFISDYPTVSKTVFYRNLFGVRFTQALSIFSSILFFYFITLFYSRKEYKSYHYLYFSLWNFCGIFSYLNNTLSFDFANSYLIEILSKTSLIFGLLFASLFIFEFSKIYGKKKKLIERIFYTITIFQFSIMVFQPTTKAIIDLFYIFALLIHIPVHIFLFFTAILYFRKKITKYSIALLAVYSLDVLFVAFDLYYSIYLGIKPVVLLIPYIIFLFNIIMFFMLAWEQSDIYKMVLQKSTELEHLTQNLEILIEKRTEELKLQTIKLAEANAGKDKFFSIVAHDLRNPFGALKGFIDLLKKNYKSYTLDDLLRNITFLEKTAIITQNFLDSLLEWSRTQMNKITVKYEKFNLHHLILSILELTKLQAMSKNIEIINKIEKNFEINTDKYILNTVLRNLITNALKYSFPNSQVVISSKRLENSLEISVTDFGVGIEQTDLPKLFLTDSKICTKGTAKEIGSGLGLIICKDLIYLIGGSISAVSQINQGSTFTICIHCNKMSENA